MLTSIFTNPPKPSLGREGHKGLRPSGHPPDKRGSDRDGEVVTLGELRIVGVYLQGCHARLVVREVTRWKL